MSLFKTAKQRYTVDFTPVYGTLNETQLLRAQQNQEGDTDIYRFLSRCTSCWQKYDVFIRNCQSYTVDFPPVYCTMNEHQLLRAQLNQERYRYTVCCHGIPVSGKKYDVAFHFDLLFWDV